MECNPEIERIKNLTSRDVAIIPTAKINGEDTEPWILIDEHKGKIRVLINNLKLYRVLSAKTDIQQALDVLLVDKIKELLDKMAKREIEVEKHVKEAGGRDNAPDIRKSESTGRDGPDAGQS